MLGWSPVLTGRHVGGSQKVFEAFPPPIRHLRHTNPAAHSVPFLLTVVQNLFKAVRKSFSVASPNFPLGSIISGAEVAEVVINLLCGLALGVDKIRPGDENQLL